MKNTLYLCSLLLCTALYSNAQLKKGYVTALGGIVIDHGPGLISQVSAGAFYKGLGFGIGFGVVQLQRLYLPLTTDFSFTGKSRKIAPAVLLKLGYGFFNHEFAQRNWQGGFTAAAFAGVALPINERRKLLLTIGYGRYSTIAQTSTGNHIYANNRFSTSAGVLF